MKTRENELHEIKLDVQKNAAEHIKTVVVRCAVCGRKLHSVWGGLHEDVESKANMIFSDSGISYCPYCGARLK